MSRALKMGDLVRVINRARRTNPAHGDIGKILRPPSANIIFRVIRSGDGSSSPVGMQYEVNVNDVELVEPETQVAIIEEMIQQDRGIVAKATERINAYEARIQWLREYGSEENAICSVIYDVVQGAGSKEEALAKVKDLVKGKLSFI